MLMTDSDHTKVGDFFLQFTFSGFLHVARVKFGMSFQTSLLYIYILQCKLFFEFGGWIFLELRKKEKGDLVIEKVVTVQ